MSIKRLINIYGNIVRHVFVVDKIQKKDEQFEQGRLEGEILRNIHSIEKGLSLEKPRLFFGLAKINELIGYLGKYKAISSHSETIIMMAQAALAEYIEFHKDYSSDDRISDLKKKYEMTFSGYELHSELGGTKHIVSNMCDDDYSAIEKIILDRHSIRDFSEAPVPMESLKKAITLSLNCPSACNRQGFHVYVLSGDRKNTMAEWAAGIGGFADKVDKYVVITGKVSKYRDDEQFQYVVSASIFSAYLSVVLQSLNIGACVVQRPLVYSSQWNSFRKNLHIPEDEQIVVMLGVGMLKKEYNVPVSKRLPYEEMVTEL